MFRLVGAVLSLVLACFAARAESVVQLESHPSIALGRPFPYMVYLPDGYDRGNLRYPVLYLLHGAGGDETAWVHEGGIQATADRLIGSGVIPPAIIVMPGCKACWWVDGAADKAETAFWSELVPTIQRRFRTIETRGGRLVAGLSAGGYGAVRFAMRYPERVVAVAALSPAVYSETPPAESSARVQPPFLQASGAFDDNAWKAQNYPSVIEWYFKQNQRVPFFLVSGDHDRLGIAFETMLLFKRLFARQPDLAELRIVDGDHSWAIWSKSIEGAMQYIFSFAEKPAPMIAGGGARDVASQIPPQVATRHRPTTGGGVSSIYP